MHARLRTSFPFQTVLAVACGSAIGALLGVSKAYGPWPALIEQTSRLGGFVALEWLRTLAALLIVSSLVLGSVGLEPMRSIRKVTGMTLQWMIFTSVLAVVIAAVVAWLGRPNGAPEVRLTGLGRSQNWPADLHWGWLGLVLIGLCFGYQRNQIEEGRGRMFTRFFQGFDEMLTPLLHWTQAASAIGIFLLTIPVAARCSSSVLSLSEFGLASLPHFYVRGLRELLAAMGVYVLTLSGIVWWKTRVYAWRLVPSLFPAMWIAATGQSLEAVLPLTMDALRRRAGVSNRVASMTLPLLAVLHRDGVALGWTSVVLYLSHPNRGSWDGAALAFTVVTAIIVGCGLGALSARSGLVPLMFLGANGLVDGNAFPLLLGGLVTSLGGAVSVFSHACAAVIIARNEGEFWVPGAPPNPDELQELKTVLDTANT